jgi:hypothetical protein
MIIVQRTSIVPEPVVFVWGQITSRGLNGGRVAPGSHAPEGGNHTVFYKTSLGDVRVSTYNL